MKFKYILCLILSLSFLGSCTEDDTIKDTAPIVGLGGDDFEENDIDRWLYKEFIKPYNINVKYRWHSFENDLTSNLSPAKEDRIIPTMEIIRDVWIKPYIYSTNESFIRNYAPKNYVLYGSPKYNPNGTIGLGEAEGGNKVTIYRLNWLDPQNPDPDLVRRILKTVHHEFCHTLDQTSRIPEEFGKITAGDYNSVYGNLTDAQARDKGFVSVYASHSPTEDFAETTSFMLVFGREWFYERVNQATTEGQSALIQKEAMVVKYLLDKWQIKCYGTPEQPGLHEYTQMALNEYLSKFEQ